jgi:hypothetical protein
MKRTIYLLSLVLLILAVIFSIFSGGRYIMSGAGIFQIGTLLNSIFPVIFGLMLTFGLCSRFMSVWRKHVDINSPANNKSTKIIQAAGMALMYAFYVILSIVIILLILGSPIRVEISFLFFPLLKVLPVGYALFELARLIDHDTVNSGN